MITEEAPRNLRDLLQRHEGFRASMYRCPAGKLTIGYGHNLESTPISERAAGVILEDDIESCRKRCELLIPNWDGYDEVRQAVLLDMCFNLGIAGLLKFVDFLKWAHLRQWEKAAEAMLDSKWHQQVGARAESLAQMFCTGQWPQ